MSTKEHSREHYYQHHTSGEEADVRRAEGLPRSPRAADHGQAARRGSAVLPPRDGERRGPLHARASPGTRRRRAQARRSRKAAAGAERCGVRRVREGIREGRRVDDDGVHAAPAKSVAR